MQKGYNPLAFEMHWMDFWQQSGVYPCDDHDLPIGHLERVSSLARRSKTESKLGLATIIKRVQLDTVNVVIVSALVMVCADLVSLARAGIVALVERLDPGLVVLSQGEGLTVGLQA
jgi:hypothetical protein